MPVKEGAGDRYRFDGKILHGGMLGSVSEPGASFKLF